MSIDACYEGVIAKLTDEGKILEISKKLISLQTNSARVLFVYELIESLKAFPKVLEVKKDDNVSTYYRNQGNLFFKATQNYEALQFYNLSLIHAPLGTESYSLALANRSAVLFSMKQYDECIHDIVTVFAMEYPRDLENKLSKRKSMCENFILKNKEVKEDSTKTNFQVGEILKFDHERDKTYICASSKLQVVFNDEMGRHVVAKEDIQVGEILAHENPYLAVVLKSQMLVCCNYCLSRDLNLLPCKSCCFALYCSKECSEKAWKEYHRVECGLLATLVHMKFTKLELLALRIVIRARTDHKNWPELLQKIVEIEKNLNTPLRGCENLGDNWVYDSKYYASIHTLESNVEKRSVSDIFQKSVTAAVFLKFLIENTDFMNADDAKHHNWVKNWVAGTLLLHGMTSPTNMHGIITNTANKNGDYVDELNIGSAPYPFCSLINHSCAPNVVRYSKLGSAEQNLVALRPIKKGMQIFDNYGSHYAIEGRRSRQESLKFQYKFVCCCEACINNWPTYLEMRRSKNVPVQIQKRKNKLLDANSINKLQKGDKGTALKLLKPLCELMELLEPYCPCLELADCQESFKQCLAICEGVVPYGKLIEWNAIPPKVK
ncbi:SET and MYND domain-containing protein 4 [Bombyx mandarina]|uniref:Protein-lysine N-methyltransferase SMYD4 n=1 Tax=Bombyx mandarina TaxID=7092 RepID=A0A6J2KHS0_BOMMA|nr:SET and MYND domain-containing protein 4 [Bombyx mandarina]